MIVRYLTCRRQEILPAVFTIKSKTTGYACGSKELIAMRRKKPPFVTIELVCQPEK